MSQETRFKELENIFPRWVFKDDNLWCPMVMGEEEGYCLPKSFLKEASETDIKELIQECKDWSKEIIKDLEKANYNLELCKIGEDKKECYLLKTNGIVLVIPKEIYDEEIKFKPNGD